MNLQRSPVGGPLGVAFSTALFVIAVTAGTVQWALAKLAPFRRAHP